MSYMNVSVALHGIEGNTQEHLTRIKDALQKEYEFDYAADIEIDIIEHSSGLICEEEPCSPE